MSDHSDMLREFGFVVFGFETKRIFVFEEEVREMLSGRGLKCDAYTERLIMKLCYWLSLQQIRELDKSGRLSRKKKKKKGNEKI